MLNWSHISAQFDTIDAKDDVKVSLNTKVESISWDSTGVQVNTNRGSIIGRGVICTVSTGILAANHIQFKPGLPDWKVDSITGLPTGTMNKICVHFERNVFGANDLGVYLAWCDDGLNEFRTIEGTK